ncbi:MAG: hypothetical protein P4L03_02390 [Terracidiphilus sp.]|nr:hypothetical protein [Terracidiphilus sp.]
MRIDYLWHDEDVLQLKVAASNGLFSGSAQPYVSLGAAQEAAELLKGFPANSNDVREISFGTSGEKFAGGYVHLYFSCWDQAGHAAVEMQFESKNESWPSLPGNPGYAALQTARFRAGIEASAIDRFVNDLKQFLLEKNQTARLVFQ